MTQDEIVRMAREAGCYEKYEVCYFVREGLERFAAIVTANALEKDADLTIAYMKGCEDMKRRMEKRMQQLESQLQLCQTAVSDEREACAKVCDDKHDYMCSRAAAAIRARNNKE